MNEMHITMRDREALKRFKHNMARFKKYGTGCCMELNMQPSHHVSRQDILKAMECNADMLAKLYYESEVKNNA